VRVTLSVSPEDVNTARRESALKMSVPLIPAGEGVALSLLVSEACGLFPGRPMEPCRFDFASS